MLHQNLIGYGAGGAIFALNYWGDGSDGAVTISADTSVNSNSGNDDDSILELNYTSLTIDSTKTLSSSKRVKLAIIYVDGDCTINGTLKLDYMGASAASTIDTLLFRYNDGGSSSGTHSSLLPSGDSLDGGSGITEYKADHTAGSGSGGSGYSAGSTGGTASSACGGGGGGASQSANAGGTGGAGNAFTGGSGGGATGYTGSSTSGGTGGADGGTGGAGGACAAGRSAAGGAGHPAGANALGSGTSESAASPGGGAGVLFLCVKGSLTIGSSGIISSDGGKSATTTFSVSGSGGGSSGGGRVIVLHAGILTNNGTIRANGGVSPTMDVNGGNGGAGVVTTDQITL